jgi:hypothetical protein
MPDPHILADREKALEDLFFEKENRRLVEKLKAEKEHAEARQALAQLTGLSDEALLDKLVDLGLRTETWAALTLVPLVEVAWADGSVDARERKAVIAGAEANGVVPGSASAELLASWLEQRPSTGYLDAWDATIKALCADLDEGDRNRMRDEILDRARRVAASAGGFLGLGGKISSAEQRVLDALATAFGS